MMDAPLQTRVKILKTSQDLMQDFDHQRDLHRYFAQNYSKSTCKPNAFIITIARPPNRKEQGLHPNVSFFVFFYACFQGVLFTDLAFSHVTGF